MYDYIELSNDPTIATISTVVVQSAPHPYRRGARAVRDRCKDRMRLTVDRVTQILSAWPSRKSLLTFPQ